MILPDSSIWLEYFTEGSLAEQSEQIVTTKEGVIVPTIVVFEVYRQLRKRLDEKEVLFAVTQMEEKNIAPLTSELSLYAAELSLKYKLAMADSIIYATVLFFQSQLVSRDNDFRNLPSCQVIS